MDAIEVTPAMIRFAAMNLLAMREHSAKELQQKLTAKFEQTDWVAQVIVQLTQDGLQSDERFSQAFIAMRKRQGKGQLIIGMELKERGINGELLAELGATDQQEWNRLAQQARQKKFGNKAPQDIKEKARQMRFLSGRGFTATSIQSALKNTYDESPSNDD